MELLVGRVLRVQDPTVEVVPRQRVDHALARREVSPSKHHHTLGLRNCTDTREKVDTVIGAMLAGEDQGNLIIPGSPLTKPDHDQTLTRVPQ